jgi:cutinase
MFGDPNMGEPLGKGLDEKTKVFCAKGDLICKHKPVILPAHWTYGLVSLFFAVELCLHSLR